MISNQEIEIAESMLQVIGVFLPVVIGLTGYLVRELRPSIHDSDKFKRKQNKKQSFVTIFGLGVVLLLVASAVAWLYTIEGGVDLSLPSFIAWGLLVAAFISVFLVAYVSITDKFNLFLHLEEDS